MTNLKNVSVYFPMCSAYEIIEFLVLEYGKDSLLVSIEEIIQTLENSKYGKRCERIGCGGFYTGTDCPDGLIYCDICGTITDKIINKDYDKRLILMRK